MRRVAIFGVGLIGGSFALALRKAGFAGEIRGVSSDRTIEQAVARGAIDSGMAALEAAEWADLVYLAQPIDVIIDTLDWIGAAVREDALVTDAGSTKMMIAERGRQAVRHGQFLGGHPMAGKETRGVQEAEAGLFSGRTYVLTPETPQELDTPVARDFVSWLDKLGARVITLTPAEHDTAVAWMSHLPQLASTALASTLASGLADGRHREVAGPGLIDQTRLALSAYDIWQPILGTNRAQIFRALTAYIEELERVRAALGGDLREQFDRGAALARSIRKMPE